MKVKYFWESFCGLVRVLARGGAIHLIDLIDSIGCSGRYGNYGSYGW